MPTIIPPGFAEAAYIITGPGGTSPFVTTIGVDTGGGGDLDAVANALHTAYGTRLMDGCNPELTLVQTLLHVGSDGGSGSQSNTNGLTYVGGAGSGDKAPLAMSLVLQKLTASFGRANRGRMFAPGSIQSNKVDSSGRVDPTVRSSWVAKCDAYMADLETAGITPVILHTSSLAPTPITKLSPSNSVGWIRGRL